MKYYVSVGRGGIFFRIAMVVTGTIGSLVYWRASRRRGAERPIDLFSPPRRASLISQQSAFWSVLASGSSRAKSQ